VCYSRVLFVKGADDVVTKLLSSNPELIAKTQKQVRPVLTCGVLQLLRRC
jgi:hypothetical protein